MNDTLVRVRSFHLRGEAELCRIMLEQEGIKAFLDGEHFSGVNWLWTNAGGGIKVMVSKADETRAKEIVGEQTFTDGRSNMLVKLVALCILIGYPVFWLLTYLLVEPR